MNVSKYTLRVLVAVGAASLLTGVRPPPAHGELICPPVDLVFIMDTSGSMDDEAAALCSSIAQVVTDLAGLGVEVNPSFLGIIQDGSADPRFPCLTDNVRDLLGSPVPGDSSCGSNLGNLEDWGAGTAIVSDRFPWAEGAIRVIVPISDEGACKGNPCNDPGDDRSAVANAIQIANADGVFVSPITGTGSTKCVIDLATDLALATGGITFQSTNPDADLAGAISAIVTEACESYSDCNSNGVSDTRDIAEGTSQDCNANSVPDECDLAAGTSRDCNSNGIPDECDLAGGTSEDCNNNSIPDECDLAAGTSSDVNTNGVPDECDECSADADCDDGLYCTGVETCVNAKCQAGGDPCVDLGLVCDEAYDECDCDDDGDCDDGVFCTGVETCVDGQCQPGVDPCVGLGLVCDEIEQGCACDEDADCDDGRWCTGPETCVDGTCHYGDSPCARLGLGCDEDNDVCVCNDDGDCDDDLFCTGLEVCEDGQCLTQAPPCSTRLCDESQDRCLECLEDYECNDHNLCTLDTCDDGTCLYAPNPVCQSNPPADDDRDGVPNLIDACPGTPLGQSVDQLGCSCSQLDDDGDAVDNCTDQCPATPQDEAVDEQGCSCLQRDPVGDDDGDGVGNCFDRCAWTAPGDEVDGSGCSCLQLDPDGDDDLDDVLNCLDLCPGTAPGDRVDQRGCTLPPAQSQAPAGAMVPDQPGSETRTPLSGQFQGGPPCGAAGLISLILLFAGLAVLRAAGGRR